MRVAWLADKHDAYGGAELTEGEFRATAPQGVEVLEVAPGETPDADIAVVHNCVNYPAETVRYLQGKRVVRYHHDLAKHDDPALREWLTRG